MAHSFDAERFIIKFIGAFDIPSDFGGKSDPFLQAYISEHVVQFDAENRKYFKLQRISNVVTTPKRLDCTSVIWNCYRDFKMTPPIDSTLIIDIYTSNDVADDRLLGSVSIPVKVFSDEAPKIFNFVTAKGVQKQKYPNFSITLSRAFISSPPPHTKTFFLIRHGESKWNLAQSKINIAGMMDRDHSLTEEGIKQAEELNQKWKEQQHEEIKPKELPGPQDSVISFLDPEDEPNFATGNLLGDFDEADIAPKVSCGSSSSSSGSVSIKAATGSNSNSNNNSPSSSPNKPSPFDNALLAPAVATSLPVPPPVPVLPRRDSLLVPFPSSPCNSGHITSIKARSNSEHNLPDVASINLNQVDNSSAVGKQQQSRSATPLLPKSVAFGAVEMDEPDFFRGRPAMGQESWHEHDNDGGGEDQHGESDDDDDTLIQADRSMSTILDDFHATNLDFKTPMKSDNMSLTLATPQTAKGPNPGDENHDEFFTQRREEYIALFKRADKVYSSPLTRAIETAFVSMEGHPALASDGLTLYSIIREIKRIGGLDTVGIEYGESIKKRVRGELKAILGKERTDQLMSAASCFNVGDADQPWWTALSSYENDDKQQERVREFLSFVRHCDAKLPVFVGHSLFFKAFYSKRISTVLLNNRPGISENLKKFRLSNASLLAVTVSFTDLDGHTDAIITDADLIFGGGFHGVTAHIVDEDECDEHAVETGQSPPQFFSIAENIKDRLKNTNLPHDLKSGKDALKKGGTAIVKQIERLFREIDFRSVRLTVRGRGHNSCWVQWVWFV